MLESHGYEPSRDAAMKAFFRTGIGNETEPPLVTISTCSCVGSTSFYPPRS